MEVTSTSLYGDRDGDRGAGGKLGKPHVRKRPATPYDRPPVNLAVRGTGSWWSKLSDPAFRLVSGATKYILPSFLTNSPTLLPSTEPQPESELEDKQEVEVIPNAKDDDPCTSRYDVPKFSERTEPSQVASDRLKITHESDGCGQDRPKNLSNDSQLSRIEQLITGKQFSRDEINRLMEILNSRGGNFSDVDGEKQNELTTTSGHCAGVKRTPLPRISDEKNQEDMRRDILRTPRTLLCSNVNAQDDVGASPIDIAKAYMGNRMLEPGHGSQHASPNDKISAQSNDKFVMKPFTPSYSHKSSTCWPGAMVQDKHSYMTPSQRGRYGLHDFPRTPYSRTIYSKPRSKLNQLQADSRHTTLSKAFPQVRTPIFGQVKSRNDMLDDSYGSVGPVRSIRNKFSSEARTRGSILLNASNDVPSPFQWPSTSKGFVPTVENNLEQGETSEQWQGDYSGNSVEEPAPLQNPSPSQTAKRILEQLDRSKPTPKEKAAELNLAMSWRKSRPEVSDAVQKNVSFLDSEKFGPLKNTDSLEPILLSQGNENEGNSRLTQLHKRSTEAEDGVVQSSKSCGMFFGNPGTTNGVNAGFLSSQMKRFPQEGSLGKKNVVNEIGLNSSLHLQSNGQQASTVSGESLEHSKKAQQSSGTKPVLPHISVGRRDPKRAVVSDNGAGFTFPATASSSVFAEPPTPSFLPVSSGITVSSGSKEVPTVPSFSFGTETSAPRLVFSFPSTGSAPNHVDSLDPTFNFGSDKNPRLSFDSVGKDAICY